MLGEALNDTEEALGSLSDNDAGQASLQAAKQQIEAAARLSGQLARISQRRISFPVAFRLNTLITKLCQEAEASIASPVELTTALAPEAGQVYAEPARTEQVLRGLLCYVLEHIKPGGKVQVRTNQLETSKRGRFQKQDQYVQLHIDCTGVDGSMGEAQQMFEPSRRKNSSLDLRLFEAHRLMEEVKGSIQAESVAEGAMVFRMLFPDSRDNAERAHLAGSFLEERPGILLVEQDTVLRTALGERLEAEGYEVMGSASPEEALTWSDLAGGPLSLVITPAENGEISGEQLWRELQTSHPEIQVILVEEGGTEPKKHHVAPGESRPVIQRPFREQDLLRLIRSLLPSGDRQPVPQGQEINSSLH